MGTEDVDRGLLGASTRHRLIILYACLLLVDVFLLLETRGWGFKDYLFPRLIGGVTGILLLAKLTILYEPDIVERLIPEKEESNDFVERFSEEDERSKAEQQAEMLKMITWTASLPVLLYVFGYFYVIPIYLLVFVWYYVDLKLGVVVSVVFSIAMYVLFVELLGITLWRGVLDLPILHVIP